MSGSRASAGGAFTARALFPLLLNTLSRWASKLPVPVIACGGIASADDALACLTLGAAAVQVDALLWRDPALLNRIAEHWRNPRPCDHRYRTPVIRMNPRWRTVYDLDPCRRLAISLLVLASLILNIHLVRTLLNVGQALESARTAAREPWSRWWRSRSSSLLPSTR